ncbi:MAG: 2-oxoacid:acceptor oxidoreductase subunit alpha [Thermoplasmata archaeon]
MVQDLLTVIVGGEAGHGVKKSGNVISILMNELGRYVFEMDDYPSLIRGGHNFSVVSSSTSPVYSHYMSADIIVCLDERSVGMHKDRLKDGGSLVYNADTVTLDSGTGLPMKTWIKDIKGIPLMAGTIGVAAVSALCGVELSFLERIFRANYPRGLEANVELARMVYERMKDDEGKFELTTAETPPGHLLAGNEAIALGAAAAGLDVYIAYPMTPASTVLHYLAAFSKKLGMAVVHPETEIAVINMALGSAYAGARTAVGSSGGGFALMHEAFSLAGMSETPLMVILASRPGPSTGVPTYTGQGDLDFALNVGHGEFPRIVLSPSGTNQAFEKAAELLNLVWKFQVPGILLTEKHLGESWMTTSIDPESVEITEPSLYGGPLEQYGRYEKTDSGISPMLFPPAKGTVVKASSYEHDQKGITTEEAEKIVEMQEKRYVKEKAIREEMRNLLTVATYGEGSKSLVTYGSTTLSALEAVKNVDDVRVVQVIFLRPFPDWALQEALSGSDVIVAELSISGQFENLLRSQGFDVSANIRQYDGRAFDPPELAARVREVTQ